MGLHQQQWLWCVHVLRVAACGMRAARAALHQGGDCMHIGQQMCAALAWTRLT